MPKIAHTHIHNSASDLAAMDRAEDDSLSHSDHDKMSESISATVDKDADEDQLVGTRVTFWYGQLICDHFDHHM